MLLLQNYDLISKTCICIVINSKKVLLRWTSSLWFFYNTASKNENTTCTYMYHITSCVGRLVQHMAQECHGIVHVRHVHICLHNINYCGLITVCSFLWLHMWQHVMCMWLGCMYFTILNYTICEQKVSMYSYNNLAWLERRSSAFTGTHSSI